jgi:hypothetical protein
MHRIGKFAQGREKQTRRCPTDDEMHAKGIVESGAWTTGRNFALVA